MALTDNPMSLIITGNVNIGATIKSALPTTETYLVKRTSTGNFTFTVPEGCNVVKVVMYLNGSSGESIEGTLALRNTAKPNNPYIAFISKEGVTTTTFYLGVTSGQTYTYSLEGFFIISCYCYISYSQSINNVTPNTTDY